MTELALVGYKVEVVKSPVLDKADKPTVKWVIRDYIAQKPVPREVVTAYAIVAAGIEGVKVDAAIVDAVIDEMAAEGQFEVGYGGAEGQPKYTPGPRPEPKIVEKEGELIDVG